MQHYSRTYNRLRIYHLERLNNPYRKIAFSFHYLAKLNTVSQADLLDCRKLLRDLLDQALSTYPLEDKPLIVGLAESGILLSALMQQETQQLDIEADWICSTRRPASGIQFLESHSHEPQHILPLPDHRPAELWIVEDEMTTGRTILQIILLLGELLPIRQVRCFTLVDARSHQYKYYFQATLEATGIRHAIYSALQLEGGTSWEDFDGKMLNLQLCRPINMVNQHDVDNWHWPHLRPALQAQRNGSLHRFKHLTGSLLVVGEAMDLAARIMQHNSALSIKHVTISPWKVDYENIFNCLQIDEKFYLYNFSELASPVHILNDPIDAQVGLALQEALLARGYTATILSL